MKVVPIQTFKSEVRQQVIDHLEAVLARAREGEVTSVAIAATLPDGRSYTGFSESEHVQVLLGAVRILEHKIINELIE